MMLERYCDGLGIWLLGYIRVFGGIRVSASLIGSFVKSLPMKEASVVPWYENSHIALGAMYIPYRSASPTLQPLILPKN